MHHPRKILVTGGAGFIGSHLVEALLLAGHRVVILDDFNDAYAPRIKHENLGRVLQSGRVEVIQGDICNAADVESAFSIGEPDLVVHMAARAGVRPSIEAPGLYYRVNCMGTAVVFEACARHGVHDLIFASSSSVYGDANSVPFSEHMRIDRPVSPYAATKQAGEAMAHAFAVAHSMNVTCLRFFTVYGPRQRPEMAIHQFMRKIRDGDELRVFGDGSTSRDYTFVTDIVQGILKAVGKLDGFRVYNLGSGAPIGLLDLIGEIGEIVGKPPRLRFVPMQAGDVIRTYADVSLATRELGYAPQVRLRDGLSQMWDWLSTAG